MSVLYSCRTSTALHCFGRFTGLPIYSWLSRYRTRTRKGRTGKWPACHSDTAPKTLPASLCRNDYNLEALPQLLSVLIFFRISLLLQRLSIIHSFKQVDSIMANGKISRQPSHYPPLPFHFLRLAQLLSSIIVASILYFFIHHLATEHYTVPWTFILVTTPSPLPPYPHTHHTRPANTPPPPQSSPPSPHSLSSRSSSPAYSTTS